MEKCLTSGIPFALVLPMQILTTRKFVSYAENKKMHIRLIAPSPSFKKQDGTKTQVGEIVILFGNFPCFDAMTCTYDFDIVCRGRNMNY